MNKNKYLTIKTRIRLEVSSLSKLEDELRKMKLYPKIKTDLVKGLPIDDIVIVRAIAGIINDYYTCIERILSIIARTIDNYLPAGDSWHMELIEQMNNEIIGVRPYVISPDTLGFLGDMRSFRHVFRGKYGFNLEIGKLTNILEYLPELSDLFKKDIELFFTKIEVLYDITSEG